VTFLPEWGAVYGRRAVVSLFTLKRPRDYV
jgi:hypothetical protein